MHEGRLHVHIPQQISQLGMSGHLNSTTPLPQHEHEIRRSGLAAKYSCTGSMKIPHVLYATSL
jgi:hypothetical protein